MNFLLQSVETNLNIADFLDIGFEIIQDIYEPYKTPNNGA